MDTSKEKEERSGYSKELGPLLDWLLYAFEFFKYFIHMTYKWLIPQWV